MLCVGAQKIGLLEYDSYRASDVANFLAADCLLCHGPVPKNGAPERLDNLAALQGPAYSQPSKSNGALCSARTVGGLSASSTRKYCRSDASPVSGIARACGPNKGLRSM